MNTIWSENQKAGSTSWKLDKAAANREIEGYASKCSINKGESILFFINTASPSFSFSVYRMGWYKGAGGRKVFEEFGLKGTEQEVPLPDIETGLVECDWKNPLELTTDHNWVSGVYVVKLVESLNERQSYIIFVLRDDERASDILFQLPMTTYQAYNYWGGKNLYEFGSGSDTKWGHVTGVPAVKVSFNRPYAKSNNPRAAYGMGAGDFFTNTRPVTTHKYPISSAGWDYNMVRWLEKESFDVTYCTSVETHGKPQLIQKSKALICHGHDEYWSHEMRKNVTDARDSGINIAFISSNTMFWQIRFENSTINNQENRTIVCYKNAKKDPIKGKKISINFRNVIEQGSEADLIGINYILDPVLGDIRISNSEHWIFKGSGLRNGDRLKGLLGYEIDAIAENSPINVVTLATSVCQARDKRDYLGILKYMANKMFFFLPNIVSKTIGLSLRKSSFLMGVFLLLILVLLGIFLQKYVTPILVGTLIFLLMVFLVWFIKIMNSGKVTSHMTIYEAKSGAQVFATGSMQWSWGLDDFNTPQLRPKRSLRSVEIITRNLLEKFS